MKAARKTIVFLPENLDLEKIVRENPPSEIVKFDIDALKYIAGLVYSIPVSNRSIEIVDGFVPINAQILQRLGIRNYNHYLNYLIENGILEINRQYIPGKRSRGYRYNQQYCRPVKILELDKSLDHGLLSLSSKYARHMKRKYSNLYRFFNPKLKIDYEGALEHNEQLFLENKKKDYAKAILKFNLNKMQIEAFRRGDFRFHIDPTGHRLHTNFTNLSKEFRRYTTYNNETLVEIDIKNSQPFHAILLFGKEFREGNFQETKADGMEEAEGNQKGKGKVKEQKKEREQKPHMLGKSIYQIDYQSFRRYKKCVTDGTFYEAISNALQDLFNVNLQRDLLKKKFFASMFGMNHHSSKVKKAFESLFPGPAAVFSAIKMDDHAKLAVQLQRIESSMILDRICKSIARSRPGLPIFTIHDSIVTTLGNEYFIAEIIREEYNEVYKCCPQLKFERWLKLDSMEMSA